MAAVAFCFAEYALKNASVYAESTEETLEAMTGLGRIKDG